MTKTETLIYVGKMQVTCSNNLIMYLSGINANVKRNFWVIIAAITHHIRDKSFQTGRYFGSYYNKIRG